MKLWPYSQATLQPAPRNHEDATYAVVPVVRGRGWPRRRDLAFLTPHDHVEKDASERTEAADDVFMTAMDSMTIKYKMQQEK